MSDFTQLAPFRDAGTPSLKHHCADLEEGVARLEFRFAGSLRGSPSLEAEFTPPSRKGCGRECLLQTLKRTAAILRLPLADDHQPPWRFRETLLEQWLQPDGKSTQPKTTK